jgi:hypothetical protein
MNIISLLLETGLFIAVILAHFPDTNATIAPTFQLILSAFAMLDSVLLISLRHIYLSSLPDVNLKELRILSATICVVCAGLFGYILSNSDNLPLSPFLIITFVQVCSASYLLVFIWSIARANKTLRKTIITILTTPSYFVRAS